MRNGAERLPAVLGLAVLFGCSSGTDAERYRAALGAPGWEEARHRCEGLADPRNRGDCLVAVMEQHQRLDVHDCDALEPGLWYDECLFQFAERANKAGRLDEAFAACESSRFGRECSYHLIRQAAWGVIDEPLDEAIAAASPYRGLSRAPDAPHLFWQAFFREIARLGRTIDPRGCPDADCWSGARDVVFQRLNGMASADPAAWCAWVPPPGAPVEPDLAPPVPVTGQGRPAWVDSPELRSIVIDWSRTNCARWRDRGAGGRPPG